MAFKRDKRQGGEIVKDADIVDLFWARDERAITEASIKYEKYCSAIARNILENQADVEESVNDTWLNAWNSMPPHRPAILQTFLGKITRFICLKRWRTLHSQKRGGGEVALAFEELSESIPDGNTIEDSLNATELARILTAFLLQLSDNERDIFVCRYWYLDPISSICEQFHFSQSRVKTMLWRTRAKLKAYLIREGIIDEI